MSEINTAHFTCKICGKRFKADKIINQRKNGVGQKICGKCGEYYKTSVKMALSLLLGIIIGLSTFFVFDGNWVFIVGCYIVAVLLLFLSPLFFKLKGRNKYYTEDELNELWKK